MVQRLLLSTLLFLAACAPVALPVDTLTPTQHGALTPYLTATPSRTAVPPTRLASTPITPMPSPTQLTHKVVAGENLTFIARKYGVTLENLLAANPNVQSRVMQPGDILVIPAGGALSASATVLPTPTVIRLESSEPLCYPSSDGGAWCVLQVTNDQTYALEDLTASISLRDAQGKSLGDQTVPAPLNLLRSGASTVLMAYFAPPLPTEYRAHGQVLSALPIQAEDSRYLDASIESQQVEIIGSDLLARVRGQVVLPIGSRPAILVWLAAIAYDGQGHPIGLRKLELSPACPGNVFSGTLTSTLKHSGKETPTATATHLPCPPVAFDFTVYSLGPQIVRVEILIEAR